LRKSVNGRKRRVRVDSLSVGGARKSFSGMSVFAFGLRAEDQVP
jgi:hypothetical protein